MKELMQFIVANKVAMCRPSTTVIY